MFLLKVVLPVLLVLSYGVCEPATNETEPCVVTDSTAVCQETGKFPLDVRITKLVVRNDSFTKIGKSDLAKYEKLEIIDFSNSELEEIDPEAFTTLENLEELNLSANKKLKIANETPFISSKSLVNLNLSGIAIEELSEKIFSAIPNLKIIDLSFTTIKNFSPLSSLSHLTTLVISKDALSNKTTLCHENHLKEIILKSDNEVEHIKCEAENEEIIVVSVNPIPTEETTKSTKIISDIVKTTESSTNINEEKDIQVVDKSEDIPKIEMTTESLENSTESKPEVSETTVDPKSIQESTTTFEILVTEDVKPQGRILNAGVPIPQNLSETESQKPASDDNQEQQNGDDKTDKPQENTESDDKTHNKYVLEENPNQVLPQDDLVEGDENLPSTSGIAQSSGTNIILGIILCVMVVGAVGFGFKYWKNRRSGYRNANTEENLEEGKELQTIVAHHTDTEQN